MRALSTFVLAAAALAGMAATAMATPVTFPIVWDLNAVQFSDGGKASGSFSINQFGFIQTFDITTTNGSSIVQGFHYTPDINATINAPSDTITIFNHDNPDYLGFLQLTFENPLTTPSSDDPIVAFSFECNGFQQLDGSCLSTERTVLSGSASSLAVPEPMTLALFGTSLLGLGFLRRRA
jgi:hypothetical protein